jgi:hypothetical protein
VEPKELNLRDQTEKQERRSRMACGVQTQILGLATVLDTNMERS